MRLYEDETSNMTTANTTGSSGIAGTDTDTGTYGSLSSQQESANIMEENKEEHRRDRERQQYYGMKNEASVCDQCSRFVDKALLSSSLCFKANCSSQSFLIWAILSFLYWSILWSLASSFPSDSQFMLKVGETWQIDLPAMWSRSSFGIQASSVDPGLEVYEFAPTLLGQSQTNRQRSDDVCPVPTVAAAKRYHQTEDLIMDRDNRKYNFNYFHLNVGSTINLNVRHDGIFNNNNNSNQTTDTVNNNNSSGGAFNVYLLRGYGQLKQLLQADQREEESNNPKKNQNQTILHHLQAESIENRFVGYDGQATLSYSVSESDVYVLVYDSIITSSTVPKHVQNIRSGQATTPSSKRTKSRLHVEIDISITTHLLPKGHQVCNANNTNQEGGCLWKFYRNDDRQRVGRSCIIVKAVSSALASKAPIIDTTEISPEEPMVKVQLISDVGSKKLIWLCCVPILLGIVVILHKRSIRINDCRSLIL